VKALVSFRQETLFQFHDPTPGNQNAIYQNMFYKFAEHFSHVTRRLSVIWEVETALAGALAAAIDSGNLAIVSDIGADALAVLDSSSLPPDLLAQCCAELEHVLDSEQNALQILAARTASEFQKNSLWIELKADAGKIRAGMDADGEFATYQFGHRLATAPPPIGHELDSVQNEGDA